MATAVTGGDAHTCALLDDGRIACWGNNDDGQLGNGSFAPSLAPVIVNTINDAVQVDAGARHTCARRSDDTVWCWGDNATAQAGGGVDSADPSPIALTNVGNVSAGGGHTCTHVLGGAGRCWGAGTRGQLSNNSLPAYTATPQNVQTVPIFRQTEAGAEFTCGVTEAGVAYCWGDNQQLQSGDSTSSFESTPNRMGWVGSPGPPLGGNGLAVANASGCVIQSTAPWCWGDNEFGQLADGTTTDYHLAKAVPAVDNVQEIAGGGAHFCARRQSGDLRCWGKNTDGQVGDGTNGNNRLAAVEVMGLTATGIGAGSDHTCAVVAGGAVMCWGKNADGQLGTGNTDPSNVPVAVTSFP